VKIPHHSANPSFHKAKGKSKNPKNKQIKTRVYTMQNTKKMILTFQITQQGWERNGEKCKSSKNKKKGEVDEKGRRERPEAFGSFRKP